MEPFRHLRPRPSTTAGYGLRLPRCVSTGPVVVRLAGMANERERELLATDGESEHPVLCGAPPLSNTRSSGSMATLSRALLRASRPVSSLLSRQAPVLAVRSLRAAAPVQSSVPTVTTDNGTVGKRCHRRRCSIAGRYPGHLRCAPRAGLSHGNRACLPESDRSLASRHRPQSPSTSLSTLIHLPITWRRCATLTPPTVRSTTR